MDEELDQEAMLASIYAAPYDDAPRLVYADWLQERGDPRGEFIRAQVELREARLRGQPAVYWAGDPDNQRYQENLRTEQRVFREHGRTGWHVALPKEFAVCVAAAGKPSFLRAQYIRGFVGLAEVAHYQLVASPCNACFSRGFQWTGQMPWDSRDEYTCAICGRVSSQYGHGRFDDGSPRCPSRTCENCQGCSRWHRAKYQLAALRPSIDAVRITDRVPLQLGHECYGYLWGEGLHANEAHVLPAPLWDPLAGTPLRHEDSAGWKTYPSIPDAICDLENVALEYVRRHRG